MTGRPPVTRGRAPPPARPRAGRAVPAGRPSISASSGSSRSAGAAGTTRRRLRRTCNWSTTIASPTSPLRSRPVRASGSCSPAIRCRRTRAPNSSRSSARDRSTRICSKTRAIAWRNSCARRDTGRRGAVLAGDHGRRAGHHVHHQQGPAVPRGDDRRERQQFGVADRAGHGAAHAARAAVLGCPAGRRRDGHRGSVSPPRIRDCQAAGRRRPLVASDGVAEVPVAVRIVITEGARTTVDRVVFDGNASVDRAALEPRVWCCSQAARTCRSRSRWTATRSSWRTSIWATTRHGRGPSRVQRRSHARRRCATPFVRAPGSSSATC